MGETSVEPGTPRYFRNERSLVGIRKAKEKDIEKLCAEVEAMDIESNGLIGENIAGAATQGSRVLLFRDIDDLLLYALSRPHMIAHNGAGFDFPRLIARFFALELHTQYTINSYFSGDRMIALAFTKIGEKKACSLWMDTYAQVPASLAAFTKAYAPEQAKLSGAIDFESGEIWSWDNPEHIKYLERDVLGLKAAYCAFAWEMYHSFGIKIGMSAAGNALKAFRVSMLEREELEGHFITYFRLPPYCEEIARRAAFGGWVFPGVRSKLYADTVKKDFKGAYGAIMRDVAFPIGGAIYTTHMHSGFPGIYTVRISAPDFEWCASVPFRDSNGSLRYLAAGHMAQTTLLSEAIIYYQSIGYKVDIIEGIYWTQTEYIFRDLMLRCETMEHEGGARKDTAKLVRNGLSGRFNLGDKARRYVVTDTPPNNAIPCVTNGHVVPYVHEIEEALDDACMLPHLYAYITGLHRLKMVKLAHALGPDNFLYCDTDSVETPRAMDNSSLFYQGSKAEAHYGDCITESYHSRFICFGPKHYYAETAGKGEARLKGIPRRKLTPPYIEERLGGWQGAETFSYESPTNARMMLKSGGSASHGIVRTRAVAFNTSDTWRIDALGSFVPIGGTPLTTEVSDAILCSDVANGATKERGA